MGQIQKSISVLEFENTELRARLEEAEETLEAIRSGQVEALVIGDQIFTLESSESASNRFRGHVLERISDIVIAIDPERRLTYVNPAAEIKYNVRSSDVLGQKIQKLYQVRWLSDGDMAEAETTFERAGYWHGENIHITNDGGEFYADITVSSLRNNDGSTAGMLAVIRDITAWKQAEAELRDAHDKLEAGVIERTAELAETNLVLRGEIEARIKIEKQRGDLLQRVVTAQEEERRRIAKDIHDHLGQRMTALRLKIAFLTEIVEFDQEAHRRARRLQEIAAILDSEISFLGWELRPLALDELGLTEAIKAFVAEWSRHYRVATNFHSSGPTKGLKDPNSETHLYRITQEALNNVAKHASATSVTVLLERSDDTLVLIVEDDGKGFDPKTVGTNRESGKGLGLAGMRERATLLAGDFEIETGTNKGTTVFVRVPFVSKEE